MKKFDKELTYKQKLSAIKKIRKDLQEREQDKRSAHICYAAYNLGIIQYCHYGEFEIIFPEIYKKLKDKCINSSLGYSCDFETRYQFLNELEKELKEKHNEN